MKGSFMKYSPLSYTLCILLSVSMLNADTITQWLDLAHKARNQKLSDLALNSAQLQSDAATAALYPKLTLIGSVEHFNAPTSLRPVTPTEMQQGSSDGYPFSKTIMSAGGTLSMPLFVKSLFTNIEKAKEGVTSQSLKRRIDIAGRDALLIATNAKLTYLENFSTALEAKERSLNETRKTIEIKTKNGRLAEIELVKIDEQINQTHIKIQENMNEIIEVQKIISTLIDLHVTHSATMELLSQSDEGTYLAIKAKEQEAKVAHLASEASKESLYPTLVANANYFYKTGDAYNNNASVSRDYGSIALTLSMPLFDKERLTGIELSRVEEQKARESLSQTKIDTLNSYRALVDQYTTLKNSRILAVKSVENYETMLTTARVAYTTERMTQEEYLRYEESLLSAKASLYAIDATLWQNIAQRAALSGKDFKEIVK
jgi:outer membrane protein TolC